MVVAEGWGDWKFLKIRQQTWSLVDFSFHDFSVACDAV